MTNYNGVGPHNVESILASIRSTIGDEQDPRFAMRADFRHAPAAPIAEEAAEFELPAIFKPGHAQSGSLGDARPNLLGRLSDALKPVGEDVDRSRTVIRFDPAKAGRMIEPPAPVASAARPEPRSEIDAAIKAAAENADAPRQMASFFDTRMKGMSSTPAAPPREPPVAAAPPPPPLPPLPALPDRADAQALGGAMDDAAAQMLRPILRQWLTENMPKIVEKALRSEAVGELPQAGNEPPARKTLR